MDRRTFLRTGSIGLVVSTAQVTKAGEDISRPELTDPPAGGMIGPRVVTAVDGVWVVSVRSETRVIDSCCRITFFDYPEMGATNWIPQSPPVTGEPFPTNRLVPIAALRIIGPRDWIPEALTLHVRGPVLSKSGFEEEARAIEVKCGHTIHFLGPTSVRVEKCGPGRQWSVSTTW